MLSGETFFRGNTAWISINIMCRLNDKVIYRAIVIVFLFILNLLNSYQIEVMSFFKGMFT